ncbi:MAG: hypothetical protein ACFCD0_16590 [Gemmataceae bacterium]
MKAALLVYAGLFFGGGMNPAIWDEGPNYTVTARVVKIDAQGNRQYITIPKINATLGQDYHVSSGCNSRGEVEVTRLSAPTSPWQEAFEESTFEGLTHRKKRTPHTRTIDWMISVTNSKEGTPRIKVSYTATSTDVGENSRRNRYLVDEQIAFGEIRRVVLTRDSIGRPTSWMEVEVNQQGQIIPMTPKSRKSSGEAEIKGVFPFYYEAF